MKLKTFFLSMGVTLCAFATYQAFAATEAAPAASAGSAKPGEVWTERCNKNEKAEGPKRGRCEIFQRLIVKDTGQRVVEMAIGFPKEKKSARGIIIVPLGILLQPGIQMKVDDKAPFKFQSRFCDTGGCYGFVDLNDKILADLKAGKKIVLSFQTIENKTMNVELSLKDFVKALGEIS